MATLLAIVLLVIVVWVGSCVISAAWFLCCHELCGSQRQHQPNRGNRAPFIEDREKDTESDTESESSDGDGTFNDERSSDLESQRTILPDENALTKSVCQHYLMYLRYCVFLLPHTILSEL